MIFAMCGDVEIVTEKAAGDADIIRKLELLVKSAKPGFMDVTHTFRDGVYTRSGHIKAGEIIIGAKHKAKNIFHLSCGQIWVFDNVNGLRLLTAPHSEISVPGIQRVGLAVSAVEGCNIMETKATTAEAVEAEMLEPFCVPTDIGEKILKLIRENQTKQIV